MRRNRSLRSGARRFRETVADSPCGRLVPRSAQSACQLPYTAQMARHLPFLLDADPTAPFPPAAQALRDPDGLLAIGGDLAPQRLLNAYAHGIFPWFSQDQPILWWSPDPRMVFRTDALRLSSRFRRQLRSSSWTVRADTAFEQVIDACASVPRAGQDGTWITAQMQQAYIALHELGHAHSLEVFDGTRLVGGIYGVAIGQMFFGESMFSAQSGGSKVALVALSDASAHRRLAAARRASGKPAPAQPGSAALAARAVSATGTVAGRPPRPARHVVRTLRTTPRQLTW